MTDIDPTDPYERHRVEVLGTELAYVDTEPAGPGAEGHGSDRPTDDRPTDDGPSSDGPSGDRATDGGPNSDRQTVVLLHGNPTSSYLWRNVIRMIEPHARCLAPDLVGMGDSGPSSTGSYRFTDHAAHLDAWFDAVLPAGRVVLVIHDWGSGLGFHWAHRHPDRVAGIVFMEALVTPVTWADWPDAATGIFQAMRSDAGEQLVLEKNVFVERILPASIVRTLTEAEHDVYRKPFAEPGESRRPTLTWPREIPIDGQPADVHEIIEGYGRWLASHPGLPKVFVNADPGSILTGRQREVVRSWPDLTEVTVTGSHFVQEDSPAQIGAAVVDLLDRI